MDQPALNKLILTLASADKERAELAGGDGAPTPACLPTSRLRTAVLRENCSDAERNHLAGCAWCRKSEQLVRSRAWHPSLVHLFWHARGLLDSSDADVGYHLQKDGCRRCLRLATLLGADRVLARLAGQIRAGLAQAAHRLGRALASGAVATISLSALAPGNLRLTFEDGKHALVIASADPSRLRLEMPAAAGQAPCLLRVLVGDTRGVADSLVVPHSTPDSSTQLADVLLSSAPSERVSVALYEVDPSLLAREDEPALRAAFQMACKLDPLAGAAWQGWATHALQRPDLDAALRPALEALSRPDAGKYRA